MTVDLLTTDGDELGLKGKSGIVIGATGGLGEVITRHLANKGANLFVHGHDNEARLHELETVASEGALADLRSEAEILELFAKVASWCKGSLDFVVYAAGLNPSAAITANVTTEHWTDTLAVNVTGAFFSLRAALPIMRQSPNAKVVVISSIFGVESAANRSAYGASKHALHGLVQSLMREEGSWLHINALCPGPAWTENVRNIFQQHARERGITVEEYVKQRVARIPAGRFLEPIELARCVAMFCSPVSDYINGQMIKVTGGASE